MWLDDNGYKDSRQNYGGLFRRKASCFFFPPVDKKIFEL